MANSIRTNVAFRALLTRAGGATGKELQACTGRAYVYSVWSLRTMTDAKRPHLMTIRTEGEREIRFALYTDAQFAAHEAREAKRAAKEQVAIAA